MNHNIKKIQDSIEENNLLLLEEYANLLVTYEETRQLHEKVNTYYNDNSLDSSSTPIISCYEVMTDNNSWCVTKWQLINVSNSKVIYTSEPNMRGDSWGIALNRLSVANGTQFYLKAAVEAGSDSTSSVILQYSETSTETAMFELTGTTFDTTLYYRGLV